MGNAAADKLQISKSNLLKTLQSYGAMSFTRLKEHYGISDAEEDRPRLWRLLHTLIAIPEVQIRHRGGQYWYSI